MDVSARASQQHGVRKQVAHNLVQLAGIVVHKGPAEVLLNGEPGEQIIHRRGLRQGDSLSPMLFILVMEVLTKLVRKAEDNGLLLPLSTWPMGHRLSIYADDVVLFASPTESELAFVKSMMASFGQASGLKVNIAKSAILPIRCDAEQTTRAQQQMECVLASISGHYLDLSLSIG